MAKQNRKLNKKSNLSSKIIFWVIGVVAVFIIGFIFLGNHANQAQSKQEGAIDYSHVPYLGKASAPVSIIEFGDYKCSNCKNFNDDAIPAIKQQLIDTGKAKLYFMNDSFINTDSIRSAKFAESVYEELGNQTFWKFHDLLYQKQPTDTKYETMDIYTEKFLTDTLKEFASQADVNKVVKNFDAKKSDAAWQRDMDLAKKLHVDGTPTLFVNGELFNGKTIDDLTNMVNQAEKGK
jgi:protein-disulfide isomerase